tara:strand:- start:87 stop:434 length:348 start_codon:yes stop_codon:yes gene_type:complete
MAVTTDGIVTFVGATVGLADVAIVARFVVRVLNGEIEATNAIATVGGDAIVATGILVDIIVVIAGFLTDPDQTITAFSILTLCRACVLVDPIAIVAFLDVLPQFSVTTTGGHARG